MKKLEVRHRRVPCTPLIVAISAYLESLIGAQGREIFTP
jgi:hypothetical protein